MIRAVSLGAAVLVNPADDVRDAAVPGVAELGPCHLSKAPQGLPLLRAESRSNQHPAAPAGLPSHRPCCCSIATVYLRPYCTPRAAMPERGYLSRCIDSCAGAKWHSADDGLPEFGPSEAAPSREAFCFLLGSCVAEGLLFCVTVLLSGLQDSFTAPLHHLTSASDTQIAPCKLRACPAGVGDSHSTRSPWGALVGCAGEVQTRTWKPAQAGTVQWQVHPGSGLQDAPVYRIHGLTSLHYCAGTAGKRQPS